MFVSKQSYVMIVQTVWNTDGQIIKSVQFYIFSTFDAFSFQKLVSNLYLIFVRRNKILFFYFILPPKGPN